GLATSCTWMCASWVWPCGKKYRLASPSVIGLRSWAVRTPTTLISGGNLNGFFRSDRLLSSSNASNIGGLRRGTFFGGVMYLSGCVVDEDDDEDDDDEPPVVPDPAACPACPACPGVP